MSRAEREAFLADVHVGVLAVESEDGPPTAAPVWYLYTPGGDVLISTDGSSTKCVLMAAAGRATLCVQRERRPYAYVSVDGPVSIEPSTEEFRLEMALRYLDETLCPGLRRDDGGRRPRDGAPLAAALAYHRLRQGS